MPENTQIALLTSKSLPELICSELEGWIAQGKVSPGQPLREADISAQMGLSRGPVREAFRILEERGLVCCEKNRGVRVGNLTLEQVKEIYELRETLEGLIGRLAAERAGAAEKAALKGIVEEMSPVTRSSTSKFMRCLPAARRMPCSKKSICVWFPDSIFFAATFFVTRRGAQSGPIWSIRRLPKRFVPVRPMRQKNGLKHIRVRVCST